MSFRMDVFPLLTGDFPAKWVPPNRGSKDLLVVFHGTLQEVESFSKKTDLQELNDSYGVALLFPQARFRTWMRSAVDGAASLIDRYRRDYDLHNVYGAGFSRGGWFLQHLDSVYDFDGLILHSASFANARPSHRKPCIVARCKDDKTPTAKDFDQIIDHYHDTYDVFTYRPHGRHEWAGYLNQAWWSTLTRHE